MADVLYRAFTRVTLDTFGCTSKYTVQLFIDTLSIIRRTPKGAWIRDPFTERERWISTTGRKRFACPTEREAIESLIARTKKRRQYLTRDLRHVEAALEYLGSTDVAVTEVLHDGWYTMGESK